VHDDIDLSLGSIRFRPGGSSGGQKGVKSVIDALGTQDFARLRIGIRPSFNDFAIAEYVLETFSGDEKITMEEVIKASVSGIETWVNEGLDKCMTKHNKKNTAE
jgi:PTH1 family peptidyl-tRNA hydrolase